MRATLMVFAVAIIVTGVAALGLDASPVARAANAQDVSLELRAGAGGVEAVLRWTGIADPSASYQIERREAPDVSPQTVVSYATVPASARHADGTFEFVDEDPTSLPGSPCYSIGAVVGSAPSQSSTPSLCLPVLPGLPMQRLILTANPGPDAGSWYVTGANFAPGSDVIFKEDACAVDSAPIGQGAHTTFDGYAVALLQIGATTRPHTLVACQRGWLPEQDAGPPSIMVAANQPAVGLGYPLTTATGVAEVDRVLRAIAAGPDSMLALLQPHDATNQFGEHVVGVPAWQCGQFVSRGESLNQQAQEAMPPSSLLYVVYRVDPQTAPWQLFDGADYAVVLATSGISGPLGAVVAVSQDGIVGFGWSCGSLPPSFVRANAGFVIAPPTTPQLAPPAPPAAGSGVQRGQPSATLAAIAAIAAIAAMAAGVLLGTWWASSRRRGQRPL